MRYKLLIFVLTFCLLVPSTFGMQIDYSNELMLSEKNLGCSQNNGHPIPPLPGELTSNNEKLSPFELLLKDYLPYYNTTQPAINTIQVSNDLTNIVKEIDKNMVLGFIENLTSFGPRVTGSESCEDAGRWIYQEFKEMGLEVRYQNWSATSSIFGSNIEATLAGANPDSDEIYIVCGHYDSVYGSPGADDNAAGTAAVLSAAEAMNEYSFEHTVRFVTFSGEEQGLHGSYRYAQEAYQNDDNIVGVLNADMMGYAPNKDSEEKVVVFDNDESSWIRQSSSEISSLYDTLINLDIVHGGSSGRSDHASFHTFEYDAIFYFEYEMNPQYHSPHDTIEHMNPWYASNVSRLILATVSDLAGYVPQGPPETPDKPSGRRNGKIDTEYMYETKTVDPNADEVFYKWSWGNGSTSNWLGPFESNEICQVSHIWSEEGDFEVKVKAKDSLGAESDWSDPLSITMPKYFWMTIFNLFFERFDLFQSSLID